MIKGSDESRNCLQFSYRKVIEKFFESILRHTEEVLRTAVIEIK